jgi:eukaryotic-like serine/threonine-protein kinase
MDAPTATVGRRAPKFDLPCTGGPGSRGRAALADYRDRWLVLVFYPRDFSLVCPTELLALNARLEEFRRRGCELLAVSTDSLDSHERWIATPRALGGLGGLDFPLGSDPDGATSRAYGVYLEQQRVALRGLFIIDPNGVLQYQAVHNLSVGRRSDEVLRVLAALETGGMCPEDWCADCAPLDPTRSLVPGSMISHYRIEGEVGRGTFGSVYRARDTALDRLVAVKVFNPGSLASSLVVLTEARAAAALNHPNVCTIFAVDDSEGAPFIAMEYVAGQPLSGLLQGKALPPEQGARVGRQVALGMAAAHALNIVHGDLKPANILLSADGVVKITDFGLSRRAEGSGDSEKTVDWPPPGAGKIAGTPLYMSPEQTRGEPVTPASDVFTLGVVLHEMLTGRKAFAARNVLQVLHQIRTVDPNRWAAEVPAPFDRILRGALLPEASDRLLTMGQIAELLGEPATTPRVT